MTEEVYLKISFFIGFFVFAVATSHLTEAFLPHWLMLLVSFIAGLFGGFLGIAIHARPHVK